MKAILMSIQPKWVAKILNGEKTIEIRKRFPKDYRGWVYIYCTKAKTAKDNLLELDVYDDEIKYKLERYCNVEDYDAACDMLNRKVVARFYCDHIETFYAIDKGLCKLSCLLPHEINNYLQSKEGYAIYIWQLEIFNKPKELSEFKRYCVNKECTGCGCDYCDKNYLTKAPQSWQYVEVEE